MAPPKQGEPVGVRLPPELLARIDTWSREHDLSRAQGMRALLLHAVEHPPAEEDADG